MIEGGDRKDLFVSLSDASVWGEDQGQEESMTTTKHKPSTLCTDCGRYEATVSLQEGAPPVLCNVCTTRALGVGAHPAVVGGNYCTLCERTAEQGHVWDCPVEMGLS